MPALSARSTRRPASCAATLAVLAGLFALSNAMIISTANAQQRNPLQTIGETVADRASAHYRFERFTLSSVDGSRTWRVHVGIPRTAAPAQGFPSFWMLDGNGALMEFDDALVAELAQQAQPQVLVFIGYDNELRIDSAARSRDYTPELTPDDQHDTTAHPLTGGADAFLDVIERRIRPEIERRATLDPGQRTLWGHSLGGLFVLHTLYTRTGAFQTYASGSPSMWWRNGLAVREGERFITHNAGHPARVLIHLGGAERIGDRGQRDMSNPRVVAHLERVKGAPPDAAMQLAQRLQGVPGIDARYREFEGLGHGPMFRASLMSALHSVTGVADRSGGKP